MSAEMLKTRRFETSYSVDGSKWRAIEARHMDTMGAFLQFVRSPSIGWVVPPREDDPNVVLFSPEPPSPEVICSVVDGAAHLLPVRELSHLGKRMQIIVNPQAGLSGAPRNACASDLAEADIYGSAVVLTGTACVDMEEG